MRSSGRRRSLGLLTWECLNDSVGRKIEDAKRSEDGASLEISRNSVWVVGNAIVSLQKADILSLRLHLSTLSNTKAHKHTV